MGDNDGNAELDRLKIIEAVINGILKLGLAAERLGITDRQTRRLVNRVRAESPSGKVISKTSLKIPQDDDGHSIVAAVEDKEVSDYKALANAMGNATIVGRRARLHS